MSELQRIVNSSRRELNRKIRKFAAGLVGKKVRIFWKNNSGPDFDRQATVEEIIYEGEGAHAPLFLIKDERGDNICIWEDSEITEIA